MEKEKKKSLKPFWITLVVTFSVIALISGIIFAVENIKERKRQEQLAIEESNKVTVPNVVGMTYKEAREELEKLELKVDGKLGNSEDDNIVTTQDPPAEERIKKGETVIVYLKTPITVKSNNIYGMRFRKTIPEFCKNYNNNIESIYNQKGEDTSAIGLDQIKESDFLLDTKSLQNNFKQYCCNKIGYSINIFTELDSEYIVFACVGFNENSVANVNKMLTFTLEKTYPATVMSLTDKGYSSIISSMQQYVKEIKENGARALFEDNVVYNFPEPDNGIQLFYVYAMSEEKYKEATNGTNQTSNNADQQSVAYIQQTINTINSQYGYNFQPDNEQMEQIIEFYNTTNYTGDFDTDSLLSFLNQKGWIDTTQGKNNSSSTQQSSSSSQNSSNKSSNTNNTSKEVTATLNINLKELIAKNTTATEIKNESERIDIHIYVEDALVQDDYFEYFNGGASVPDTITTTVKVYENEKKLNDKRQVKITMDNTRTLIKETTLYDGGIVFDKSKTYEVK